MIRFLFGLLLALVMNNVTAEKVFEDEIVWASESDPIVKQAIKDARATLSSFLKKYDENVPNIESFKLKVMISDENGTEHFWLIPFNPLENGKYQGIIANEPRLVKNVKLGQSFIFSEEMISDWGYVEDGKQIGSYTICALFKTMPKEQVEFYRKNHGFQC